MKKWVNKTFLLSLVALLVMACEKDEEKTIFKPGAAPALTASSSAFVLEQANAGNTAVSFTWNPADFGYNAAVGYSLQISKKGANFASASTTELSMGNTTSKSFKVGELNRELLKIISGGVASDLEVRVKSSLGVQAVAPVYSNVVSIKATPYRDLINFEFPQALRVAGNFQNWSPGTAPKIVDKSASGTTGEGYEGYINFTNATPEFKLVKGNDWPAGDFGSAGAGALGNGGSNLTLTQGAGIYRLQANTKNMTWSATKINSWGVIGSATPGGWGSDTDLTYNPATNNYTVTLNLTAEEIKFRANDGWDINLGDNNNDGVPEYGGNNIKIATAGNYTITLDLGVAGNYSYTIKKN